MTESITDQTRDHPISNGVYDVVKPITTIILPGLATLYFAIAGIWGLPYAQEVIGTVAAVVTFLGIVLGLSSKSYNNSQAKYDGSISVDETEDKKTYSLELNTSPEDLDKKKQVVFKVQ